MNIFRKKTTITGFAYIASIVAVFAWISVALAARKFFWWDEGLTQDIVRNESFARLVFSRGIPQTSINPLYYLLQKAFLMLPGVDAHVLVGSRIMNLVTAAALVLAVFWFFRKISGYAGAALALWLLFRQTLFFEYSAEDRQYMIWLLFFSMSLFYSVLNFNAKPARLAPLAAVMLLLGLSATVGPLQAISMLVTILFLKSVFSEKRGLVAGLVIRYSILSVALLVVLFYYYQPVPWAHSKWNLYETGGLDLVRNVIRLFLQRRPAVDLIGSVFVLTGAVSTLVWLIGVLKKRAIAPFQGNLHHVLGVFAVVQLLVFLVLAASVVKAGYYFVPRLFIYLMICRMALGATGFIVIKDWLQRKMPDRPGWKWAGTGVMAAILLLPFYGLYSKGGEMLAGRAGVQWKKVDVDFCGKLGSRIIVWNQEGVIVHYKYNLLAHFAHAVGQCGNAHSRKNILVHAGLYLRENNWVVFSQEPFKIGFKRLVGL
ncbi:MAG: hypothetical protein A2583_05530 [Bdellovibrionales bacterium RIFOXYD1_FULL_53_11]|nr:MAG: hypothetical protein A2583_05530 [Bdellovibrionales bacterium RIFOXYD1_FULL_53_11]